MYGYVCKHCGARLDPGEKCDCEEEKQWSQDCIPEPGRMAEGRKGHIGGSDASVCVGMNPYKDNIQLWEEKTGLVIPEDISDKSYVKYGTEAEQHIRTLSLWISPGTRFCMKKTICSLILITHGCMRPWTEELIDENGRHGILEIKTTNILQSMPTGEVA